jgi:hypothetical protein
MMPIRRTFACCFRSLMLRQNPEAAGSAQQEPHGMEPIAS